MAMRRKPRRLRSPNNQVLIFACLGTAIAVASVFIAAKPQVPNTTPPPQAVQVVSEDDTILLPTPIRAIAKGERLRDVPFSSTPWPKNRVLGDFMVDVEPYKDSIATAIIPKHIPVPISALSRDQLDINEVVDRIPEGMRGITVKVDAETAVEGWARAGNFVDVSIVRKLSERSNDIETAVVAENVKILSAGQSTETGNTAARTATTVTLLVSQEDALKIQTAALVGKVTLSLRGKGDSLPAGTQRVHQRQLVGGTGERPAEHQKEHYNAVVRSPDGRVYVFGSNNRLLQSQAHAEVFRRPGEDEQLLARHP